MSGLRTALTALPDAVFADLLESEDAYRILLDLPGVSEETLDVTASNGRLRIEAHRDKPDTAGYQFVAEQRDAFLDIDLPLPPDVTAEGTDASIDGGVLELTIPKRSAAVTEIEVGDA